MRKMFKKIIIFPKKGLNVEKDFLEEIKKTSNAEVKIICFDDLNKSIVKNADLIITIGGDGTFVRAANLIEESYILGINAEPKKSEGALTSIKINEIEKLHEILLGKFEVVKRQRVKIKLNGRILDEHALNEVYIGAASQFHSSRYKIKFKDDEEEHRSSGVIISTGTGSPAWYYSAGGEIFGHEEEKLEFIIREPYFGKRIFTPKILRGEIKKGEKIIIKSKRHIGGIVAINDSTYDFNEGDVVEVELSDKPLFVLKPKISEKFLNLCL